MIDLTPLDVRKKRGDFKRGLRGYDTVETFPVVSGNTTTGTGQNAVYVPGGVMTTSGQWPKPGPDFPYPRVSPCSLDSLFVDVPVKRRSHYAAVLVGSEASA